MPETPNTPYDEVAYPSRPFQQTHPARMALPAALLGLPFAPAATARVLEIGCGEGGNIIPLALSYPEASVVGFDLAETAIAKGRRLVETLDLRNIDLRTLDIAQADPATLGRFDYIIVHGVYSWVPEPVRQATLRLIRDCLTPDGLAFVSYNALPGCHVRLVLREMVLQHLRGVEGVEARLAAARAFLAFFVANAPDDDPTIVAIKAHARSMLDRDPHVLFHDELGSVFQPFYFHEFVAGGVAEFVVDALEVVDVDDQRGQRVGAARRAEQPCRLLVQREAVQRAGERIGARQLMQFGLHRLVVHQQEADAGEHRLHCAVDHLRGIGGRVDEQPGRACGVENQVAQPGTPAQQGAQQHQQHHP
ncbi:MAG TPA: class I SAM-dependent methyltransferase, partial [Caulobacter sp.]|nr:class I SAM-dependent methyltransferase [Caulobacter sp.]